jgi:hypothetical protein
MKDYYVQKQDGKRRNERRERMLRGDGLNVRRPQARIIPNSRLKFKRLPNPTTEEINRMFPRRPVTDASIIKGHWEKYNFAKYGDIRGDPEKIKQKRKEMAEYRKAQKNAICFDSARLILEKRAKKQNKTMRQVVTDELSANPTDEDWQDENEVNDEVNEVTDLLNQHTVTGTGNDYDFLEATDAPQYDLYMDQPEAQSGDWGPETIEGADRFQSEGRAKLHEWASIYHDSQRELAVREFKDAIQPHLDREAARPQFDMRLTIERLDSRMNEDVEMRLDDLGPFDDADQRVEAFSAILQMANEGKIIIKESKFPLQFRKVQASKRATVFNFRGDLEMSESNNDDIEGSDGNVMDSKRSRANTAGSTSSVQDLRPQTKRSRKT